MAQGRSMIGTIYALVFTLLLALPGLVAADCAWVLWAFSLDSKTPGAEQYSIELARPTRQECLTEVRDMRVTLKDQGYTVTGGAPGSSEVFARQGTTRFKYFCLPDTVDPRGPKGK